MVSPGQITAIPVPIPDQPSTIERLSPSPNDSRRTMEIVPHVIAMTVITIRLRWIFAAERNRRRMTEAAFTATASALPPG